MNDEDINEKARELAESLLRRSKLPLKTRSPGTRTETFQDKVGLITVAYASP